MEVSRWWRLGTRLVVVGSAAWIATLVAVVAMHAMPVFDDLCRATFHPSTEIRPDVVPVGFVESQRWLYFNWSGRWAANPIAMAILAHIRVYPAIVLATLLVAVVGTWMAARRAFEGGAVVATLALWAAFWSSVPGPRELFFWASAALEALPALTLALIAAALTERARSAPTSRGDLAIAVSVSFLVGGFHELAGLLFAGLMGWRWLYLVVEKHSGARVVALILIAGILGVAANLGAPGNWVRAGFLESPPLARTLTSSASQYVRLLKSWLLTDVRVWALALLVFASPALTRAAVTSPVATWRRLTWLGAAFATVFAGGVLAPTLAFGTDMPQRTQGQVFFMFLVCWVLAWRMLGQVAWRVEPSWRPALALSCALVLVLSAAVEGNSRLARREWAVGALTTWRDAQRARHDVLRNAHARGDSSVVLPAIPVDGAMLPTLRDSPNPDYAHNLCLAWAFDVAKVSVDVPPDPMKAFVR